MYLPPKNLLIAIISGWWAGRSSDNPSPKNRSIVDRVS